MIVALEEEKDVQLIFGSGSAENRPVTRGLGEKAAQEFAASISEIELWFKQFQIDSIELWISGAVESGGVVKLFVSAKGEGGLKVTLKPRDGPPK